MTYNVFSGTLNPTQSINQTVQYQNIRTNVQNVHCSLKCMPSA